MDRRAPHRGFTLVELILVIGILSILAGAILPSMRERLARSRDVRRLSDIRAVREAIEQYYADHGVWPPANENPSYGDWDVSHDGNFISVLSQNGYLLEDARDPIGDDRFHYRYHVYDQGSFGCVGETPFYVLGIREFESDATAVQNSGCFTCSGRDWNAEFDYVTGGGATER